MSEDDRLERIAEIARLRFGPMWPAALCDRHKIPRSAISQIINGERRMTEGVYRRLLAALDIELVAMRADLAEAKRVRKLLK
jgi:plasmid maintenance system antidote protein VapI